MITFSRSANGTSDGFPTIGTKSLRPLVAWAAAYITWFSLPRCIRSYGTWLQSLCFIVTRKAKRYAVGRIAPKIGVFSPSLYVVYFKTNTGNAAMTACVVISFENGSDERSVLRRFVMPLALSPIATLPYRASFAREVASRATYRTACSISFQEGFGNTENLPALRTRQHKLRAIVPGAFSATFSLSGLSAAALRARILINGYLRLVARNAQGRPSLFWVSAIRAHAFRHSIIIPVGDGPCN